jgi:hypothetical protein
VFVDLNDLQVLCIHISGHFYLYTKKARLGKPSLVRETSRIAFSQLFKQPVTSFQRLTGIGMQSQDALKGIVLEESLDSQLRKIAVSTAHTKKNRAPFRHLLLHGKIMLSVDVCCLCQKPMLLNHKSNFY